jgi:putative nucleotidyltransferase with HDIG domain
MMDLIELPLAEDIIELLANTPQNPKYHGEGDVLKHTQWVLQVFEAEKDRFDLSESEKKVLYWASILHDIGKPRVTQWSRNRWTAHGHEVAGLPLARKILLANPDINDSERHQILDLVKFHSVPLQWGLKKKPLFYYKKLALRTDLRLLGIFSLFDIKGRDCVSKEKIIDLVEHFNHKIVPQVNYEWGQHRELKEFYQKASTTHKNALWHALKQDKEGLVKKLLQAEGMEGKNPAFQTTMTISKPDSSKSAFLHQHFSGYKIFEFGDIDIRGKEPHQRELLLRRARYFLSIFSKSPVPILINGELRDMDTRMYLTDFIRQLNGEINFLFFDEDEDRSLEKREPDYTPLDYPHPWEAHQTDIIKLS